MGQLRGNITHYLIFFHFSRKIKESLECFPVKLNNLIHTLAQMTAISPAKSTSQAFSQESCMPGASRSIQRATVLGFSKKTSHVSFKTVILTLMSFDYISHFASLHTFFLIPCLFFFYYAYEKSVTVWVEVPLRRTFQGEIITTRAVNRESSKRTAPALW